MGGVGRFLGALELILGFRESGSQVSSYLMFCILSLDYQLLALNGPASFSFRIATQSCLMPRDSIDASSENPSTSLHYDAST